eukprot:GILI01011935.1.p1 GENE.GILI01011935.1~~GILI01011935.1.p1  ORF type:complete len:328 (+),score=76.04 GILI01011935.1:474-1457(+)
MREGQEKWDKPKLGCPVQVKVTGRRADGSIFLQATDPPLCFTLGEGTVTDGLEAAVENMKEGQQVVVTCSPAYAYGEKGSGELGIGGGERVSYEVELVGFERLKDDWKMSFEEKVEDANRTKELGNGFFKAGRLLRAIKAYERAMRHFTFETNLTETQKELSRKLKLSCLSNTCVCRAKLGEWREVVLSANKALELDKENVKVLFRRGQAMLETGEWEAAREDLTRVKELDPENREVKVELARLKKKVEEHKAKQRSMFGGFLSKGGLYSDKTQKHRNGDEDKEENGEEDKENGVECSEKSGDSPAKKLRTEEEQYGQMEVEEIGKN